MAMALIAELVVAIKEGVRMMSTRHHPVGGKRTVLWWRAAGATVVVPVVAAVSLAACGRSPSTGVAGLGSKTTSPSSAAQTPAAGALRYASCMRSNGVTNYPDPSSRGRSQSMNQVNPNSLTFLAAYKACQKYAPNGEGGGPPAPSAAQLRVALAFAQCMHKHGFPQFPDPLATAPDQPDLTMGPGMYFPLNSTTDFESPSPAFRQAAKACGVQVPPGL
jgi:hypothetical protein